MQLFGWVLSLTLTTSYLNRQIQIPNIHNDGFIRPTLRYAKHCVRKLDTLILRGWKEAAAYLEVPQLIELITGTWGTLAIWTS